MPVERRPLILSPFFSPNVGGVETHLDDLVDELARRGRPATVLTYVPLTTRASAPRRETRGTVDIVRIRWPGGPWYHRFTPHFALNFLYLAPGLFFATLLHLVRHPRRYGVIHANGLTTMAFALPLARLFGLQAVASTHACYGLSRSSASGRVLGALLRRYDRILCLSQQSRAEVIGLGVAPDRVDVYTYWVDLDRFSPAHRSRDEKEPPTVLFVGRLIEEKGIRQLVEAARDPQLDGRIRLDIVGDGPLARELAIACDGSTTLHFHGRVANAEVPAYLRRADILIIPSQHQEGFGRVILEACAAGVAVVGSDRGGILEAIGDSGGWLIEPSVAQIRQALLQIADDPAEARRRGAAARANAERRFSRRNAQTILDALDGGAP